MGPAQSVMLLWASWNFRGLESLGSELARRPWPFLPPLAHAGSVLGGDGGGSLWGFEDGSWEVTQSCGSSPSIEMLAFTLQVMALGPILAACAFVYYLFINHKSRKDFRRLMVKDTNIVKLLKQNRP